MIRSRLLTYLLFYLVLAAALTLTVAFGYQSLRSHPAFAIDTLVIEGASTKTETDLRNTLGWVLGRNFFGVDLGRVRREANAHPWVLGAGVRGFLPRTLRLVVSERRPVGLARFEDRILVIAEDNRPIAAYDQYAATLDFPVLIGLDGKQDTDALIAIGLAALARIRATSLLFWDQIETLDLSDEENMIVQLRSVDTPIYLGKEVIPDNIHNFLSIAYRLERDYPNLKYIELGFPHQIAIMPKEVK